MRLLRRLAAIVVVGVLCATHVERTAAGWPAADLPSRLTDQEFWRLTEELSEASGFFQSDNLLSNEPWFSRILPPLVNWLSLDAVWGEATPQQCRAAEGACWALVSEKHRVIFFGRYPFEEHWRPLVGMCVLLTMVLVSCFRRFWRPWIALVWVGGPVDPAAVVVLAEFEEPDDAATIVVGDVGFLPPESARDEVPPTRRARVFAGYAGWGPGQLEAELEQEAWVVEPAAVDDVFVDATTDLWSAVLRRKGGQYAILALMPADPSVN